MLVFPSDVPIQPCHARIFAISFANLLCIDIDEKDGCDKTTAAAVVERYAESHGLTFRLLETDRGMHAYCTSRTMSPGNTCCTSVSDVFGEYSKSMSKDWVRSKS